jgi:hypothetical protein
MEQETRRSIYLREEAVRKSLQTPEGLVALQRDPYVRAAYAKMQAAQTQRVEYDERVLQGAVAPDQARDRDMEERGMTFASVPMNGVVIAGITRYGNLAYYVLRDDVDAPSLLSCDPALEPLRDYVFDVVRSDGGFTASLRYAQDGVPMRVLDQLKSSTANGDVAERYANHRAALRSQRATAKTPVVDQVEAQIIEALLRLAGSLTA